jgi:hypothetical protein
MEKRRREVVGAAPPPRARAQSTRAAARSMKTQTTRRECTAGRGLRSLRADESAFVLAVSGSSRRSASAVLLTTRAHCRVCSADTTHSIEV